MADEPEGLIGKRFLELEDMLREYTAGRVVSTSLPLEDRVRRLEIELHVARTVNRVALISSVGMMLGNDETAINEFFDLISADFKTESEQPPDA